MNTRLFGQFLKVADLGSVSKAAVVLGVSQPALSRAISELETEIGVRLLYRDGRGVRLTEHGERFCKWAADIEKQVERMRSDLMGESDRLRVRQLTIGLLPSVARSLAIPLTHSLQHTYPNAELHIIEGATGHLVEWLVDQRIDIALLYDVPAIRRFNPEPLISHPMHLVCAPSQRLLLDEVPFADLCDLPLILAGRQVGNRREFEGIAARQKMSLKVIIEADSLASMIQLVAEGMGYSILPIFAVHKELEDGSLVASPIVDPSIDRTLVLAGQNNRAQLAGLSELTQDLKGRVRAALTLIDTKPSDRG